MTSAPLRGPLHVEIRDDSCVLLEHLGGSMNRGADTRIGATTAIKLADIAESISSSVGVGFASSKATTCMIWPDWQ